MALTCELGVGGFGHVFLGWVDINTRRVAQSDYGTPVAVKVLNPEKEGIHDQWMVISVIC